MTLLHNMSVAPRTTIVQAANPDLELTNGLLLRLNDSVTDTSGKAILALLGMTERLTPRAANARLCKLLNERALALPYTPTAVISDRATGREHEETDLLTVCAVLSKSSRSCTCATKNPTSTESPGESSGADGRST